MVCLFKRVFSSGDDDAPVDVICNELFDYNSDIYVYVEGEFDFLITYFHWMKSGWMNQKEKTDGTGFVARTRRRSLKRRSALNDSMFLLLLLCPHQLAMMMTGSTSHGCVRFR
jgi:hypothetical protein